MCSYAGDVGCFIGGVSVYDVDGVGVCNHVIGGVAVVMCYVGDVDGVVIGSTATGIGGVIVVIVLSCW